MYVDSSENFPVAAFIIGGIAVGAVVSVIVVLGVKSCTSENTEKEKMSNDLADAIVSNTEPKDAVKIGEGINKTILGDLSTKSYTLPNYEARMNAISKGNYGSYGFGRAVFDSTYEEDLFDVILSLKIWG